MTTQRRGMVMAMLALAALMLLGMESTPRVDQGDDAATLLPSLLVMPILQRIAVDAGASTTFAVTIQSAAAVTLLAGETDCRCVHLVEATPLSLPAGASTVRVAVSGGLPGMKLLTLRTTGGSAALRVQVVGGGFGEGRALLTHAVDELASSDDQLVVVVHDLAGQIRNCGCSSGSLGGVDHLAALPTGPWTARSARMRYVLTGDIDGHRPGLGAALADAGWEVAPADILVTADPASRVADPALLAIISTTTDLAHAKVIRPILGGGTVGHLLRVTANGTIVAQQLLPIDRTLPSEPTIIARFPEPRTWVHDATADPSLSCRGCHPSAWKAWSTSRHANALASLPVHDQVDACITCHTTAVADVSAEASATTPNPRLIARASHVGCTACHQGTQAHAAHGGQRPTTGLTACRTCHDASHHPAFDPALWTHIAHGREPRP